MGIGVVILLWTIIFGTVGTILALILSVCGLRASYASLVGVVFFISPFCIFAYLDYDSNRYRPPEEHWELQFDESPPQTVEFLYSDAAVSSDFYERFFWLITNQETINAFAQRHGFTRIYQSERKRFAYGPDKKRNEIIDEHCEEASIYEGPKKLKWGLTYAEAAIRFCPSNGKTLISIVNID